MSRRRRQSARGNGTTFGCTFRRVAGLRFLCASSMVGGVLLGGAVLTPLASGQTQPYLSDQTSYAQGQPPSYPVPNAGNATTNAGGPTANSGDNVYGQWRREPVAAPSSPPRSRPTWDETYLDGNPLRNNASNGSEVPRYVGPANHPPNAVHRPFPSGPIRQLPPIDRADGGTSPGNRRPGVPSLQPHRPAPPPPTVVGPHRTPPRYASQVEPPQTPLVTNGGAAQHPAPPAPEEFEPGKIIAIVDGDPILAGDLLPMINQVTAQYEGKAPPDELRKARKQMMQQLLSGAIETKIVYKEFLRTVPEDNLPMVLEQVSSLYDKTQLEDAMKKAGASTPADLDKKLREFGSSLAKQRRQFTEQTVAREVIRSNVDFDIEVSHEEMLEYYRTHAAEYEILPKVRWEQLMVRFEKYDNKAEAYRAIAEMGNQVLRGAQVAAVAKRHSHGSMADEGGMNDWTTQGSLAAEVVDKALFELPVGRLSRILESDFGFHIVRVVERRGADKVPFEQAQVEIKEAIRKERVHEQIKEYVAKVKGRAKVWTIFDKEDPFHAELPNENDPGASSQFAETSTAPSVRATIRSDDDAHRDFPGAPRQGGPVQVESPRASLNVPDHDPRQSRFRSYR